MTACVFCGQELTNDEPESPTSGKIFSERNGEAWLLACWRCVDKALRRYYSLRKYEKRLP